MNLFAIEPGDARQPLAEVGPEGRQCVGVVEHIFGHQRQVDATKKQKSSQTFYSAGGVDRYQAKIVVPRQYRRHLMHQIEIGRAGISAQNHQPPLIVLALRRRLLGQRLLLGRHGAMRRSMRVSAICLSRICLTRVCLSGICLTRRYLTGRYLSKRGLPCWRGDQWKEQDRDDNEWDKSELRRPGRISSDDRRSRRK